MTDQIKAHTLSNVDSHARFHDGEWLTVLEEATQNGLELIVVVCVSGTRMYLSTDEVYRRREIRLHKTSRRP